jgi:hypothetical protein
MYRLRKPSTLLLSVLLLVLLFVLMAPALAAAELPASGKPTLVLPFSQLWALVVGLLSPLVAYVLNTKLWRNMPEPYKAFIHVLVSAVAGAIYTAAATPAFGWNDATFQLVLTSVLSAFAAHGLLWKPSGVQARLTAGAGREVVHR